MTEQYGMKCSSHNKKGYIKVDQMVELFISACSLFDY